MLLSVALLAIPGSAAADDVPYPQTLKGNVTYTISWPSYTENGSTYSAGSQTLRLTNAVFTYDPANSSPAEPSYLLSYTYTSGTASLSQLTSTTTDNSTGQTCTVTATQDGPATASGDAISIFPSFSSISLQVPEQEVSSGSDPSCTGTTQTNFTLANYAGSYDPETQALTFSGSALGSDGHTTQTISGMLSGMCTSVVGGTPPGGQGFMVVSGSFAKTSTKWTSCGGTVRVNGIDLIPNNPKTTKIVFNKTNKTVTSSGPVTIPVGHGRLFSGTFSQPLSSSWTFTLPGTEDLAGLLPDVKKVTVDLSTNDGGSAEAFLQAGFAYFPDELSGDVASLVKKWANALQLKLNWNQGEGFAGGSARISQLFLGPLQAGLASRFRVQQLVLAYHSTDGHDVWSAEVKLGSIPNGKTENMFGVASGTDVTTASFTITDRVFTSVSISAKLGTPIPLGTTGYSLQSAGGGVNTDPANHGFSANGTIGLIWGPKLKFLGSSFYPIGINGNFALGWGRDCGTAGALGEGSPGSFYVTASGDVSFYNQLKLVTGGFCVGPQFSSFGGHILSDVGPLHSVLPSFDISGFTQGFKYFQGTAKVRVPSPIPGITITQEGDLLANNTGINVCVRATTTIPWLRSLLPHAELGLTYLWGAGSVQVRPGCQQVPLAPAHAADIAAADAGATAFRVPKGAEVTFAVSGPSGGGPPAVSLTGPGHADISVPAGLSQPAGGHGWAAYADPQTATTYLVEHAVNGGLYAVSGGTVSASLSLKSVRIRGHVSKRKHKRTAKLIYATSGLGSRRLEFLVSHSHTERVLTVTRRARGTLRVPAGRGRHTILVEVLSGGFGTAPERLARY